MKYIKTCEIDFSIYPDHHQIGIFNLPKGKRNDYTKYFYANIRLNKENFISNIDHCILLYNNNEIEILSYNFLEPLQKLKCVGSNFIPFNSTTYNFFPVDENQGLQVKLKFKDLVDEYDIYQEKYKNQDLEDFKLLVDIYEEYFDSINFDFNNPTYLCKTIPMYIIGRKIKINPCDRGKLDKILLKLNDTHIQKLEIEIIKKMDQISGQHNIYIDLDKIKMINGSYVITYLDLKNNNIDSTINFNDYIVNLNSYDIFLKLHSYPDIESKNIRIEICYLIDKYYPNSENLINGLELKEHVKNSECNLL